MTHIKLQDFLSSSADKTTALLFHALAKAALDVYGRVSRAGLTGMMGAQGGTNVHGEQVQKLDVYANEIFLQALKVSGVCCGVASEENEDFIDFGNPEGRLVVMLDPLDGSSNIDVSIPIGTVFSVFRRVSKGGACVKDDFLQKGSAQLAAGYFLYGSSTMLVFTLGKGVNGFTLDPKDGVFYLSHPEMQMPKQGKIYSVNQGSYRDCSDGVRAYIDYCMEQDKATSRPYTLRYVGSMAADVHRTLLKGGIFIYPATKSAPNGKLRLLYECNPMSFITEQAGGSATDGVTGILSIPPQELHQRTPVFLGSHDMMRLAQDVIRKYDKVHIP